MTTSIDPSLSAPSESPSWYWDDNTPGVGDRPDYLPEKFKSVADAAKSYSELEKRFGNAPNEYDLSKGESWIEPDYEPFKEMLGLAKDRRVPQDVVDSMLDSVGKYLDEFKIAPSEELAKLGDNAEERLKVLDTWAQSNFSKETYEALTSHLNTANAIKAIEEIRTRMNANTTVIPGNNADLASTAPTLQEVQAELNNNLDRYKKEPAYRREITAKIEAASKNSGYVDKMGR